MILLNERMKGPGNITQGDLSLLYNHIVTSKVTKVHVLPILFFPTISQSTGPYFFKSLNLLKNVMYKKLIHIRCLLEMCLNSLMFTAFNS